MLGLRWCARAFSSCGECGLLFVAVCGLLMQWLLLWSTVSRLTSFSSCGSRALERRLSSCGARGLVAPWHVGSSQTRARTRVPCIGRQILNHCATREAPGLNLYQWEVFLPHPTTSIPVCGQIVGENLCSLLFFYFYHFSSDTPKLPLDGTIALVGWGFHFSVGAQSFLQQTGLKGPDAGIFRHNLVTGV